MPVASITQVIAPEHVDAEQVRERENRHDRTLPLTTDIATRGSGRAPQQRS
ncbi:hypothetical protein ACFPRL_36155 [Pseudoclavibacter helvolus]